MSLVTDLESLIKSFEEHEDEIISSSVARAIAVWRGMELKDKQAAATLVVFFMGRAAEAGEMTVRKRMI